MSEASGKSFPARAPLTDLRARAFKIPNEQKEADGTFKWSSTTLIVVEAEATGSRGLGYTYGNAMTALLINDTMSALLKGTDVFDTPRSRAVLLGAVRNFGREGIAAQAISAVDLALWDLKARLLDLPLAVLLGRARDEIPVYGSGGFTTYDDATLARQLREWVDRDGCAAVKMKIGSDQARDPHRVMVAKRAIGDHTLFVDGNGAHTAATAVAAARRFAEEAAIAWFEEPVTSDDLVGMRLVRERMPTGVEVAAGEYCWTPDAAAQMLNAGAVDVQQADITRCGGVSGFLAIASLCEAAHTDLSGHCAPAAHLHAACAAPRFRHLEWFHDHVRIEQMLFDGAPVVRNGAIRPDWSRSGLGLSLREADAARFAI